MRRVPRCSGARGAIGGSWPPRRRVRWANRTGRWCAGCWASGSWSGPSPGSPVGPGPGSKGSSTRCTERALHTTPDRPPKGRGRSDRSRRDGELRRFQGRRAWGLGGPGCRHTAGAGNGRRRLVRRNSSTALGRIAPWVPDPGHRMHRRPRLVPPSDPTGPAPGRGPGHGPHGTHRARRAHLTSTMCPIRS